MLKEATLTLENMTCEMGKNDGDIELTGQEMRFYRKCEERLNRERLEMEMDETKAMYTLKRLNNHAFKALKLLQNNVSNFKEKIFRPVMLDVKLKDQRYADYLETVISTKDLQAFYCFNKEDLNGLINMTRAEGLKRNTFIHLNAKSQSAPRKLPHLPARFPFKEHLMGFLGDSFECPEPVKRFLLNKYDLNDIPVFTEDADPKLIEESRAFKVFFIDRDMFR